MLVTRAGDLGPATAAGLSTAALAGQQSAHDSATATTRNNAAD